MEKNKALNVLCFTIGGAVGSLTTWLAVKKHYENIANEEIKSVKEMLLKKVNNEKQRTNLANKLLEENKEKGESIIEYARKIAYERKDVDYAGYSKNEKLNSSDRKEEPKENASLKVYPIDEDDFGNDGYNAVYLCYYSNGKFVEDGFDAPLDDGDVDDIFGTDFETTLQLSIDSGENEMHCRSDECQCDYEIIFMNEDYEV